jgi:PAS domain S-box-containing protein
LTVPEDRDVVTENIRKRVEGEADRIRYSFKGLRKDGQHIEIEVHGARIEYDGKPAIIGTLLDITERKEAEDALRASEAKYRSLFENVLEGIYQSTANGRLLTANPALVWMLGYGSEEELKRVDIARNLYVNPAEREAWTQELEKEGVIQNVEVTLKRKDGKHITVLENAHVVRNEQGAVLYYEGTLTDITNRKLAEEALRNHDERYKKIIENIFKFVPEGILVFTDKLKLFNRNKTFEDIVRTYSSKLEYTEQGLAEIIIEEVKRRLTGEISTTIRIPKKKHEQRENRTDYSIKNP